MTSDETTCSPGSNPHADRPNWRPPETIGEYVSNCQENLEVYTDRRFAKLTVEFTADSDSLDDMVAS